MSILNVYLIKNINYNSFVKNFIYNASKSCHKYSVLTILLNEIRQLHVFDKTLKLLYI